MIKLHNDSNVDYTVLDGERIAQAMLRRYYKAHFSEVTSHSETSRGTGGLGHSGKTQVLQ